MTAWTTHAMERAKVPHRTMQRHDSERNWQRGIIRISVGGLLAAVIMVLFQAFVAGSESIIPVPDGTSLPAWSLLSLVMLMGLLGGGLGVLLTQYKIYGEARQISNTLWFNPMPVLSTSKLAVGLWMAFFGVLLVGTGALVGLYSSLPALLLIAFSFGYGQQAVTKVLDRKVSDMLLGGKSA